MKKNSNQVITSHRRFCQRQFHDDGDDLNGWNSKNFIQTGASHKVRIYHKSTLFHNFNYSCYRYACVINFNEKFMITGGIEDRKLVTLYDSFAGFVREMPGLNGKGRSQHGCGKFINDQQKLVSKNKYFDYYLLCRFQIFSSHT